MILGGATSFASEALLNTTIRLQVIVAHDKVTKAPDSVSLQPTNHNCGSVFRAIQKSTGSPCISHKICLRWCTSKPKVIDLYVIVGIKKQVVFQIVVKASRTAKSPHRLSSLLARALSFRHGWWFPQAFESRSSFPRSLPSSFTTCELPSQLHKSAPRLKKHACALIPC